MHLYESVPGLLSRSRSTHDGTSEGYRRGMAENLNNGPGSVSGDEPVAKALTIGNLVAAIVSVAAVLGLELNPADVLVIVIGTFSVANLVAGRRARRSVTPNGRVPNP